MRPRLGLLPFAFAVTTIDYTSTFRTYDNAHYLRARNGGGSDINAEPTSIGTNETFSLEGAYGRPRLCPARTVRT